MCEHLRKLAFMCAYVRAACSNVQACAYVCALLHVLVSLHVRVFACGPTCAVHVCFYVRVCQTAFNVSRRRDLERRFFRINTPRSSSSDDFV